MVPPVNFFFFQAEDGIRDLYVTGVQTCALPICPLLGVRRHADQGVGTPGESEQLVRQRVGLQQPDAGRDRCADERALTLTPGPSLFATAIVVNAAGGARGGRRRGFAKHCFAPPEPARLARRAVLRSP